MEKETIFSWVPVNRLGITALQDATQWIKANRLQWLYITLGFFATPLLLSSFFQGVGAHRRVEEILLRDQRNETMGLQWLVEVLVDYLSQYASMAILVVAMMVVGSLYLGFLTSVRSRQSSGHLLGLSVKVLFFKVLPIIFLNFFLTLILLPLQLLILVQGALLLVTPALLTRHPNWKMGAVLKSLLTLNFVPKERGQKFSIFFQVVSHGAFLFGGLFLISLFALQIVHIDQWWTSVPRETFFPFIDALPFSIWYAMGTVVESLMAAFFFSFFFVFNTSYYDAMRLPVSATVAQDTEAP